MRDFPPRQWRERAGRIPCASLLLLLPALAIPWIPGAAEALEFRRAAVLRGEVWRMVTCHWTHFGGEHLFWDALLFGVLGALCEERSRRRFLRCVAGAAAAVSCAVLLLLPGMRVYRGLSGLDSGLFALLAIPVLRECLASRRRIRAAAVAAACLAFAGKMTFEAVTGMAVFVDSAGAGMVPVPLAHVAGAVAGLLAGSLAGGARQARGPSLSIASVP